MGRCLSVLELHRARCGVSLQVVRAVAGHGGRRHRSVLRCEIHTDTAPFFPIPPSDAHIQARGRSIGRARDRACDRGKRSACRILVVDLRVKGERAPQPLSKRELHLRGAGFLRRQRLRDREFLSQPLEACGDGDIAGRIGAPVRQVEDHAESAALDRCGRLHRQGDLPRPRRRAQECEEGQRRQQEGEPPASQLPVYDWLGAGIQSRKKLLNHRPSSLL